MSTNLVAKSFGLALITTSATPAVPPQRGCTSLNAAQHQQTTCHARVAEQARSLVSFQTLTFSSTHDCNTSINFWVLTCLRSAELGLPESPKWDDYSTPLPEDYTNVDYQDYGDYTGSDYGVPSPAPAPRTGNLKPAPAQTAQGADERGVEPDVAAEIAMVPGAPGSPNIAAVEEPAPATSPQEAPAPVPADSVVDDTAAPASVPMTPSTNSGDITDMGPMSDFMPGTEPGVADALPGGYGAGDGGVSTGGYGDALA